MSLKEWGAQGDDFRTFLVDFVVAVLDHLDSGVVTGSGGDATITG
jgi:hypothetical protein